MQVSRAKLLTSATVAAGADSEVLHPPANTSWEVHRIVVSGAATLKAVFDPDGDGTWDTAITLDSLPEAGEWHGYKFELDEKCGLVVHNDGSAAIKVYLVGVEET